MRAYNMISLLTSTSQQQFSDEVLATEGKRPSRERIARLYGRCVIEAESENEADFKNIFRSNN